jgi:isocitrate/isopropylmalate dehydrogenase
MLDHIQEPDAAGRVRRGLERVLGEGKVRTHDLGGTASTTEFTNAICKAIEQGAQD